jgi:hypothetical protein
MGREFLWRTRTLRSAVLGLGAVAHACNPSYSTAESQRMSTGLGPNLGKKLVRLGSIMLGVVVCTRVSLGLTPSKTRRF